MGFLSPTDFRWILPSETDANSPLSEELMSQLRENTEANTMNRIYAGYRAQVVTRDSDTQLTISKISDDDQDWPANIAAGLLLVFRTGAALSESFTITANTELLDSPDTATITTSGTFPTGLLAGDEFVMMYVQTGMAHTHDGVNSAPVGVDADLGSGSNVFPNAAQVANVPKTQFTDLDIVVSRTIKYIYVRLSVTYTGSGNFPTNANELKAWIEFQTGDTFYFYDPSATYSNFTVPSNINLNGTTNNLDITDFSALPAGAKSLSGQLAKLDVTSLAVTSSEFIRVPVKLGTTWEAGANQQGIVAGYNLFGSTSV